MAIVTPFPSSSKVRRSFLGAPSRFATYSSVTTTFWVLFRVISISGCMGDSWPFMLSDK